MLIIQLLFGDRLSLSKVCSNKSQNNLRILNRMKKIPEIFSPHYHTNVLKTFTKIKLKNSQKCSELFYDDLRYFLNLFSK